MEAMVHVIGLWHSWGAQPSGAPGTHGGHVILVIASEREEFFMQAMFCTQEESRAVHAQLYAKPNHFQELTLEGSHLSVISNCLSGRDDAFNAMLQALNRAPD